MPARQMQPHSNTRSAIQQTSASKRRHDGCHVMVQHDHGGPVEARRERAERGDMGQPRRIQRHGREQPAEQEDQLLHDQPRGERPADPEGGQSGQRHQHHVDGAAERRQHDHQRPDGPRRRGSPVQQQRHHPAQPQHAQPHRHRTQRFADPREQVGHRPQQVRLDGARADVVFQAQMQRRHRQGDPLGDANVQHDAGRQRQGAARMLCGDGVPERAEGRDHHEIEQHAAQQHGARRQRRGRAHAYHRPTTAHQRATAHERTTAHQRKTAHQVATAHQRATARQRLPAARRRFTPHRSHGSPPPSEGPRW